MRKTYGSGVSAELDSLRMGLEKVTDEELWEMLNHHKPQA
jgi:hypothetical protein